MKWFLFRLLAAAKSPRARRSLSRRARPARLEIEALEERQLLALSPLSAVPAVKLAPAVVRAPTPTVVPRLLPVDTGQAPGHHDLPPPPTDGGNNTPNLPPPQDLTALLGELKYQPHNGPTTLYLNFDGWYHYVRDYVKAGAQALGASAATAGVVFDALNYVDNTLSKLKIGHDEIPNYSISPFQSKTGDRAGDIQEILYLTAQIFAPFNVQVRRITGDGNFSHSNGNTTIFVGRDSAASPTDSRGVTPFPFSDVAGYLKVKNPNGPGQINLGYHLPNSNPFDFAFADRRGDARDNAHVSRIIAHEAGHTFGLAHVRSDGLQDPTPLGTGTGEEIMDYSSVPANNPPEEFFANRTFTITDFNHTDSGSAELEPSFHPTTKSGFRIPAQNSYTYLLGVLGARPADDAPNVANPGTVDGAYTEAAPQVLPPVALALGTIGPLGDYDVYKLPTFSGKERRFLSVERVAGTLDPVLLVYSLEFDANTSRFSYRQVKFNNDRASGDPSSVIALRADDVAGSFGLKLVVGAANGASTGGYRLRVTDHAPDLMVEPIQIQVLERSSTGRHRVRITGVVRNDGNASYLASGGSSATLAGGGQVLSVPIGDLAQGQAITLTYEIYLHPPTLPPDGVPTGMDTPVLETPEGGIGSIGSAAFAAPSSESPDGFDPILLDIPFFALTILTPGFDSSGALIDGDPTNNVTTRFGVGLFPQPEPVPATAALEVPGQLSALGAPPQAASVPLSAVDAVFADLDAVPGESDDEGLQTVLTLAVESPPEQRGLVNRLLDEIDGPAPAART
ncbi:MAG: hypothetical protein L0Z62_35995 [Gemmataceae bacterium]|nr:hypothetical protein [Gemmataceae bacterium]